MTGAQRIIFVPGMKPKPPPDIYRRELLRVLNAGLSRVQPDIARDFAERDETFSLVPWTYRFYGSYRDIELDRQGIDQLVEHPEPSAADIAEIESGAQRLSRWFRMAGDAMPFVGRLFAAESLRVTVEEVWRYFDDDDGIATWIRGRVKDALREAWQAEERILLIGHSLGSIIAYDSLWELSRESDENRGAVDLFLTLGSPLANSMMRRNLLGTTCSGAERFPSNIRRWTNLAAIGETTALRSVASYFAPMRRFGLIESIEERLDLHTNFRGDIGLNVHMEYGYLANHRVAQCIADWWLSRDD